MNNLLQYLEDLDDDLAASQDVRDQSNEEYRFTQVPGGHWEGWLEEDYEDRAKLQMDHLSDYLRRTYSVWTNNRQSVNYSPSDDATNPDDADLLDGLFRRDVQRDGGQSAIDTAIFEAMACGTGAIILNTEYENPGDPDNNYQNIVFTEQPCAYSTVIFDASARKADKSDADHCTILTPYSPKKFEKIWPSDNPDSLEARNRSSFNFSVGQDLIYVGTRYEKDTQNIVLETFTHPVSGEIVRIKREDVDKDELELFGFEFRRSRKITTDSVYKIVHSASEILVPRTRVVGKHIPVIPCYGFRGYVDGQEFYRGIIREKMDQQRGLNMAYSLAMESAAHASEDTPVFSPEQMVNPAISAGWGKNRHQAAYLLADDVKNANGDVVRSGPIMSIPGTKISEGLATVIQMNSESIRQGVGGAPQDTLDPQSSGKAINAIFKREDMNTAMIFDNVDKFIMRIAVVYEGMGGEVYGGSLNAGRNVRTINDKGDAKSQILVQPTITGGTLSAGNDVSNGKFDVVVGVSKNYQTQQEETFDSLKDIAAALPDGDPMKNNILKMMILLKDNPGIQDLKDYVRKELLASGIVQPDTEEDKKYMAQLEQERANAPQQNANDEYLRAEAEKAESAADLNIAKQGEAAASAVLKGAQAEKTKIESMEIVDGLRNGTQQN